MFRRRALVLNIYFIIILGFNKIMNFLNCFVVLTWQFVNTCWIKTSWLEYVIQPILCHKFSGTTPRGDTGGGQSLACKHEGPQRPASLHFNICRDLQLLGLVMEREPCYLEQLFCTDTLVMLMFDNKRSVIKHNMTSVFGCRGQFLRNMYVKFFPEGECYF